MKVTFFYMPTKAGFQFVDIGHVLDIQDDYRVPLKSSALKLQILKIDQSRISFLPEGVFGGMNKLEELMIAGGNLNRLTKKTFNGLNKLKKLSLNHNNLTRLDRDLFKFQQNLEYLDISHNNFHKLEPYFFKVLLVGSK